MIRDEVSGCLFDGDELHAELLCAAGQVEQDALAIALLVVVLALVGAFLALVSCRRVCRSGDLASWSRFHPRYIFSSTAWLTWSDKNAFFATTTNAERVITGTPIEFPFDAGMAVIMLTPLARLVPAARA